MAGPSTSRACTESWPTCRSSSGGRAACRPQFELFDRRADPLDQVDLAAKHPDIVERLAKELQAWRQRAQSMRLKPDSQLAGSLSGEELERLRALGYVQ
jgi:hypothetical protein